MERQPKFNVGDRVVVIATPHTLYNSLFKHLIGQRAEVLNNTAKSPDSTRRGEPFAYTLNLPTGFRDTLLVFLESDLEADTKSETGDTVAANVAKADTGKPRISLVPTQIIRDIAAVREYGTNKYGSAKNWKNVEEQRYIDALLRHTLAYMDDPHGVDAESGLPHLSHIACNVAFLCEMRREQRNV